jgi:hypothetical protein
LELWLADAALFLRRDRAELLVVLPWQTWARLVPGMVRPGRIATAANKKIAYWRNRPPTYPVSAANWASAAFQRGQDANALDALIAAHQATHGYFADIAAVAQALKAVLDVAGAWPGAVQREDRGQARPHLRGRSDLCRQLARRGRL